MPFLLTPSTPLKSIIIIMYTQFGKIFIQSHIFIMHTCFEIFILTICVNKYESAACINR